MPAPCPYCAKIMDGRRPTHATFPTADHVIPQSLGGTRTILVCRRCNMDKGDKPIQVWQALLDRRKDPRAWTVSAFICANPWAVATVLLAHSELRPRAPYNVPGDRIVFSPEVHGGRHWQCLDCLRLFGTKDGALHHWAMVHDCEPVASKETAE